MPSTLPPNIVLILSGKGGVGKSSVTLQLALALTALGRNVGILDVDLTGPSIPRMLGLESAKITQVVGGWKPVEVYQQKSDNGTAERGFNEEARQSNGANGNTHEQPHPTSASHGSLHALSLAFLLPNRSSAVIWRGPKKTAMVRQFLSDAVWPSDLEYLLIDTPPGTSDEHISLVEEMQKLQEDAVANTNGSASASAAASGQLKGAVVVTTPQAVATSDVRKELNFCSKTGVPVLGVVENMAGYVCPCCGEVSNIFSKDGGKIMAQESGVAFLGTVPVDTTLGSLLDAENAGATNDRDATARKSLVERYLEECKLAPTFEGLARDLTAKIRGESD
ncbi:MAG: hypothetical protein Q9160_007118 [Pyrenula sp. 1 TL-2023]